MLETYTYHEKYRHYRSHARCLEHEGGGVYAADALLYLKPQRWSFVVVNTSESKSTGSHWVAIYLPEEGPVEFFYFLGRAPGHYHTYFKFFLLQFGRGYLWNKIAYQASDTILCGEYCLYCGYYRSRNLSIRQVLKTIRPKDKEQMHQFMRD